MTIAGRDGAGCVGTIVCLATAFLAMLGAVPGAVLGGSAGNPAGAAAGGALGTITRLDPRFDRLVPSTARLEEVAGGFAWIEGPVWDWRRGGLLFSDIPANAVLLWRPGVGTSLLLQPSGYTGTVPFTGREPGSNGLALDAAGRLVLAEHGDRRVARLEANGSQTTLADRYDGKRLNSPNDLVYDADGDLYFTDPPFGLPAAFEDPARELDFSGVYRLGAAGELELLTGAIRAPNGIGLSPDGGVLYVTNADPARPVWLAFDVRADGTLGPERVFFDATPWIAGRRGLPDGMAVDEAGNVFGAGPGGVYVFAADGAHLGTIETGTATSNCAFGDDGTSLYVTADRVLLRIRLATRGLNPVRK